MYSRDRVLASDTGFQTHSQFQCEKVSTNHVRSTASESEFDHENKISCLKAGVLVYTVSRLSKCQG